MFRHISILFKQSQAAKYEIKVQNTQKGRWEESCSEAEIAYRIPPEERIKRFGRLPDIPQSASSPELKGMHV